MKNDAQLKLDVIRELAWDPAINPTHLGVAVSHGVVTLSGHVETFAEKFTAEHAVQRVEGVRALALDIVVRLAPGHQRSDAEIAEAVETAFDWQVSIPSDRIQVKVEQGWVTLSGEVEWDYQRSAADFAVRGLTGVVGLSNRITLKSAASPANLGERIREALERHAQREARHIVVSIAGPTVTLRGRVDSWAGRQAAAGAVWSAPGIHHVIDEMTVGSPA